VLRKVMRRKAAVVILGCAAASCALGILRPGVGLAGDLDMAAETGVGRAFGQTGWLLRLFDLPPQPYVLVPLLVLVAANGLAHGRRADALLAASGPALVSIVNTWALKPLFDRRYGGELSYPSGHAVALASVLVLLVLLAPPGAARVAAAASGAVVFGATAVGIIGLGYHYLSDIVGAALFATAAMLSIHLSIAALLDRNGRFHRVLGPRAMEPSVGDSSS
jgi:membrane-associated phospholipid phosphatase